MASGTTRNSELEKKSRYLRVINSFAIHLMNCKTVDEVYWSVAKDAIAELGYVDCVIYIFDDSKEFLVQRAAHGPKNPIDLDILNPICLKPGEGIVGHVALTGVGEIVSDTRKDNRYVLDDNMRLSEIAVPITYHGEVIGVIDSEHPELHFYPKEDLEILSTIASITASKLIQNRYFDELTSYKNELEKLVEQRTEKLNLSLNEVQEQRSLIEAKNKDLLDSLHYAKRIQDAVLLSKQRLKQVFTSYFLFDRPKDVVSGDFFWMSDNGPFIYVAVADCTGHGVPGALLSLIGYTLLNQVIVVEPQISTAQLLNELNTRFVAKLNKEQNIGINDGMDISICRWDKVNGLIQYAGANHPLMLVRGSKLIETNSDRFSIGQNVGMDATFIDREIKVESGDQVFLFSDGFRDQFGGNKQKKYKLGPFRELIRRIALEPVEQRYLSIKNEFEAWRGDQEQTDDVTIFSFEII